VISLSTTTIVKISKIAYNPCTSCDLLSVITFISNVAEVFYCNDTPIYWFVTMENEAAPILIYCIFIIIIIIMISINGTVCLTVRRSTGTLFIEYEIESNNLLLTVKKWLNLE
jgi:hypothetical protein